MIVVEQIDAVRRQIAWARGEGKTVGLVPTMGALHEGHLSLIDAARAGCDVVVVSIFVNPTQFAPSEDLARYPRKPAADAVACESRGVDVIFMPSADEMYGSGGLTEITVGALSRGLCGRSRPAHFAGVCTVVAKLLNIVQPDRAYFGAKDFQQVAIIRRMVADLNFPVEIVTCPIVREADGLAMSSRNANLSPDQRRQAVALSQSLGLAERLIGDGVPPAETVFAAMRDHLAAAAPDGEIDYIEMVDPRELTSVETAARPVLVALAVRFGPTRLIDNVLVDAPPPSD